MIFQKPDISPDVLKKVLFKNTPYLMVFYMANKTGQYYHSLYGGDEFDRVIYTCNHLQKAFSNPLPSLAKEDFTIALTASIITKAVVYLNTKDKKKLREGIEHGAARWGTCEDIRPYINKNFQNNILLTATERLTMEAKLPKNLRKYGRNKNVLVIGGSGSGKTRYFVKPNLMQKHSSYVCTDPKGTVINETGTLFERAGFRIRVLNLINCAKSMHYNPLAYVHSEKDILTLVNTIIQNTTGEGEKANEDFWVKAERLLYTAYIGYIWYEAPEEEKNLNTLCYMLDESEVREDDDDFKNPIDLLFEELEKKNPSHFAVRQYKKYKKAAGKTAKSILISCGARLAPFDIQEVRYLLAYDELALDELGDEKTILYVIISDTDDTYNFIAAIMYTQLFNTLCKKADDVYGGKLPVHVRCILDEFANIGKIPKFEKLIATIRSREISASIILQTKSQLNDLYGKKAETISGNCDTTLFLGGTEKTTLKDLEEDLGKETIELFTNSESYGQSKSESISYQKLGRNLMTKDELSVMDGDMCILQIRGSHPFFSRKFDIESHENYKLLSDYSRKNVFSIEDYMRRMNEPHKMKLKASTEVDVYEIA